MNKVLTEKEFQKYFLERLEKDNDYLVRDVKDFNKGYALDTELLLQFLWKTQPDKMEALQKIYKNDFKETLINSINMELTKKGGSLLDLLRHGANIGGQDLKFMYTKPATGINKDLIKKYNQNIFSVIEEVEASDKERIDVVTFLNGFPIMAFELKSEYSGQTVGDAIIQYRKDRNPKTRLFLFKSGTVVNFAMDLNEVYMTTKLEKNRTFFRPFNKGGGVGIHMGAGNPVYEDKLSVSYMWEEILKKDTVLDLLSKFAFIENKETKNPNTGKRKVTENVIFPRYHQLDTVNSLIEDVRTNRTSQNYLVQHSTGSGKTNSIAWLAHRLASLHDDNDMQIFDTIIIVTDRVVVDKQLQAAVLGLEHKDGMIQVMGENCTSQDLRRALEGNTKIIATTIQKFPYIVDDIKGLKDRNFAVIIDEAHSSTEGKDMNAITRSLGSGTKEFEDVSDLIADEMARSGKQSNVSMFAFTATPKPTTLSIFGRRNKEGKFQAFHIYSMKQAIEEGYILDVLENYTTYETLYKISKMIEDDPIFNSKKAKKKIARYARIHDTNIAQRIEIIVEHFRENVMDHLEGKAKAMVVTGSREEAVRYRQAFDEYIKKKGYHDIKALIAFSGKVKLKGDTDEYTESGMNGFPEKSLTREFDKDEYRVLLVNNKYQTGFDQPKLSAMYICKKLKGIAAVQTLSRLNRIYPGYDKKTWVLDFENTYEDIVKSFEPFFEATILDNSVNPHDILGLVENMNQFSIIYQDDINEFNDLFYQKEITNSNKLKMNSIIGRARERYERYADEERHEFRQILKSFIRFYQFLLQTAVPGDDTDLHKRYNFVSYLLPSLKENSASVSVDLNGKIKADHFKQKKTNEVTESELKKSAGVTLPSVNRIVMTEDKEEKLSKIIEDVNSKMNLKIDVGQSADYIIQTINIMKKSDKLKKSATANPIDDFEITFKNAIEEALIEGYSTNEALFNVMLRDKSIREKIMGLFLDDLYHDLREIA